MNGKVLSLLVTNNFGVLTKITGLFGRRGYNIKALSVGETQDERFSRVTIVTEGDDDKLSQICSQVNKLENVKEAYIIPEKSLYQKELLLVKIKPPQELVPKVGTLAQKIGAHVNPISADCFLLEMLDRPKEINEAIDLLTGFGILELSRTGVTALEFDEKTIYNINGGQENA